MAVKSRRYWILTLMVLALVGLGAAAMNWRTLVRNFGEAWESQAEKTEIALFRLGEVASIQARLLEEFGAKPDVEYDDVDGIRVLSISFEHAPGREGANRQEASPESQAQAQAQAQAIAIATVRATEKSDQIDQLLVTVEQTEFRFPSGEIQRWRTSALTQ